MTIGFLQYLRHLPPHLLHLMLHGLVGFGLAAVFVGAILWADPFGFGSLLQQSDGHPWPALLLWFFSGLTFGSIQMGASIMLRDYEHHDEI